MMNAEERERAIQCQGATFAVHLILSISIQIDFYSGYTITLNGMTWILLHVAVIMEGVCNNV